VVAEVVAAAEVVVVGDDVEDPLSSLPQPTAAVLTSSAAPNRPADVVCAIFMGFPFVAASKFAWPNVYIDAGGIWNLSTTMTFKSHRFVTSVEHQTGISSTSESTMASSRLGAVTTPT
jgi:hypothetical protein